MAFSIKWTGVLFLGIIGLAIIYKYFRKFDLKTAAIDLIILILVPLVIYYLIFAIHLNLLHKPGSGDAYMSNQFSKMTQWQKFIELNQKMYFYNSALTANHSFGSKWFQWPFSKRPIWYWAGSKDGTFANIYLMGNIVEWIMVIIGIAFSIFLVFYKKLRTKVPLFFWFLLIGYFANLFPYILISRVTFLYHYLPSLVFGIMILAVLLDKIAFPYLNEILTKKKGKESALKVSNAVYSGILAAIVAGFLIIAPISYGMKVSEKTNMQYQDFLNIFLNNK
jgi:dolichyl-phosphate-mannose--protein O-mannosyl transferase